MRLIFFALVSFALVVPMPAVAQDLRVVTAAADQDAGSVANAAG